MKNEDWILRRFLGATSLWADHIILYDQNSSDQSPTIAKEFNKVHYHLNPSVEFNDHNHWAGLLDEARKLPGERKVIFSLDCDEFFSGNSFSTAEWQSFIQAKPGSLMVVERVLVSGDLQKFKFEMDCLLGFVDDGYSTIGMLTEKKHVHNIRLPYPQGNPVVYKMNRIKLLHYNLVDMDRLRSKNRWYQCFELTIKDKSELVILDQYYFDKREMMSFQHAIPSIEDWFGFYEKAGIDMTSQQRRSIFYWWDKKILEEYFPKYGMAFFARLHIWDIDWERAAAHFQIPLEQKGNSRSVLDKLFVQVFLQSKKNKYTLVRRLCKMILNLL